MTVESDSYRGTRFLVIAAALVIIAGGINQAQSALVSFLVAVFLAVIGTPLVLWLERKRIPSIVAVFARRGRHDRYPADRWRTCRHVSQRIFRCLAFFATTLFRNKCRLSKPCW